MILRGTIARHARRAVAVPAQRSFTRTIANTTRSLNIPETASSSSASRFPDSNAFAATQFAEEVVEADVKAQIAQEGAAKVARYREKTFVKNRTAKLGSEIEGAYDPTDLVQNPPKPEDISLEMLMAAQSHMGHNTSRWNPANQRYIFGIREGIHIISLETTAAYLRRAAKIVEGVAYHGGLILFAGTRPGQGHAVVRAARMGGGCHLFEQWVPGTITNRLNILNSCRVQAVDELDRPLEGVEEFMDKVPPLKPDLVICLNPLENYVMLQECGMSSIPTIGIIDTDADPTWVTYPIPANDDSLRCTSLIAGILGRAAERGNKKRLEAAARGVVTWDESFEVSAARDAQEQSKILEHALDPEQASKRAQKKKVKKNDQGLTEDEHLVDGAGEPVTVLPNIGFGGQR